MSTSRKTVYGSSQSSSLKTKWAKRQASKETFLKWQRTHEREHQSMAWLRADIDEEDRSIYGLKTLVRCLSKV